MSNKLKFTETMTKHRDASQLKNLKNADLFEKESRIAPVSTKKRNGRNTKIATRKGPAVKGSRVSNGYTVCAASVIIRDTYR